MKGFLSDHSESSSPAEMYFFGGTEITKNM